MRQKVSVLGLRIYCQSSSKFKLCLFWEMNLGPLIFLLLADIGVKLFQQMVLSRYCRRKGEKVIRKQLSPATQWVLALQVFGDTSSESCQHTVSWGLCPSGPQLCPPQSLHLSLREGGTFRWTLSPRVRNGSLYLLFLYSSESSLSPVGASQMIQC